MRAEGSSLRGGQRGLPLPITQPSGNMWTSVYSLRKSTPEEANCKPTEESCTVRFCVLAVYLYRVQR